MQTQAIAPKHEMTDAALIRAKLIPRRPPSGASEEMDYRYDDEVTGRMFQIRQYGSIKAGDAEFFLEEFVPNARICDHGKDDGSETCRDEPLITDVEALVGPNGLLDNLRRHDIDPDAMVYSGGGIGIDSLYHRSLDECAQAIATALAKNVRYLGRRKLTDEERERIDHESAEAGREYWASGRMAAETAWNSGKGILKGAHTMLGGPVSDEHQQKILSYLNAPTLADWLEIRGLCVAGPITLWQAWCSFDPDAPRSGSIGHPDPDMLRRVIRSAIENRLEEVREKAGK